MFNIELIKKVASGVVGIGIGCIVGGFVETVCPETKGIKKLCISAATGAVTSYVAAKVTDHMCGEIDQTMNDVSKGIEEAKAYIEKVKQAEETEVVNG